jgi:glutamyl-tRNA reductase
VCALEKTSRPGDKAHGPCAVLLLDCAVEAGWRGRLRRAVGRTTCAQAVDRIHTLAAALEQALPGGWRTFAAVHGTSASIAKALQQSAAAGVRRLVVIPLHPQRSESTSGRALEALYAALRGPHTQMAVEVRPSYGDDASYIDSVARSVLRQALERSAMPASHELVFVPNPGMERTFADYGSRAQLEQTAELVAARLGWDDQRWRLALPGNQSVDPAHALVCELGRFPSAASADESVIKTLVGLVRRGVHPTDLQHAGAEPLLRSSWRTLVERDVNELVMIGVSVHGALDCDGLRHCSKDQYRTLKRPHMEVVHLLTSLRERGIAEDCFIWSTCNRFELYGWLPGHSGRDAAIQTLKRELLGSACEPLMNVVEGRHAWRHLLRTAAGLNSALGGDGEVVDQLEGAVRTAHHAGSAGPRSDALVADAREAVAELRQSSAWGRHDHRYCWVALERLRRDLSASLSGNVLVLGGSTTSCSLLESLGSQFAVARDRMAVIYRGDRNGRLAKRLHDAVAQGRTMSVEHYTDAAVARALADADLVFLATDQREPVLHGRDLARVRDLHARPMLLIDFNTFASTDGVRGIPGTRLIEAEEVDRGVQEFNSQLVGDIGFQRAAAEASRWINNRAGIPEPRQERPEPRPRTHRRQSAGALA